jgi:aldose 1-epimerase
MSNVAVIQDAQSGSSARILVDYGFNCFSFLARSGGAEHELIAAVPDFAERPSRPSGNGTPILFPFPNRIRSGRFQFGGREFELPRNERGVNAIHGLVYDRPWRLVRSTSEVAGQFQLSVDAPELQALWPADFLIEVSYTVSAATLTSRIRVTNPDSRPLPWGLGTHPYYRLPLAAGGDESRCFVSAPVSRVWELEELLPTGRLVPIADQAALSGRRPLSELKFDTVFTGLGFDAGWCACRLTDRSAGVETIFRFDGLFRELVIYTPPSRGSICLEPYTCVTDAVNLHASGVDAGLRILQPGESAEGTITLESRQI